MKIKKTALVTGANKGIGFEIVRQLAGKGFDVFLTARNRALGEEAAAQLRQVGFEISFVEMDVSNRASIESAVLTVSKSADHLDVLVNNAGVLLDGEQSVLEIDEAMLTETLRINTIGPLSVVQAFRSLLKPGARVINVSSGGGQLSDISTWAPAYCISKSALNAVTCQLAAVLISERIPVNSVCPGWVRTDMGGPEAPRSVAEGAETVLWLATEAPLDLTGKFLRDRKVIAW